MFKEDIEYLKKDKIGGVISKGLAETYLNNPDRPVEYLAKWLLNYVKNEKENLSEKKRNEDFKKLSEKILEQEKIKLKKEEENKKEQEKKVEFKNSIYKKVEKEEFVSDLLNKNFFEELKKIFNLNSIQFGKYDFGLKEFNLNEDDNEKAHLEIEGNEKYITFLASDFSNEKIIRDFLPKEESSIYELFEQNNENDENSENKENDNNEENNKKNLDEDKILNFEDLKNIKKENLSKFSKNSLFIDDVIKSEKNVFFFGIPKFGSQISTKLQINNYQNKESFEDYLIKLKDFLLKQKEINELKEKDLQDYELKISDLQEKPEELKIAEEEFKNLEYDIVNKEIPKFSKEDFVFIFDNLGFDQQFSEKKRFEILKFCYFFQNRWNFSNFLKLEKDVENYLKITEEYNGDNFLDEEEEILNQYSEFEKEFEDKLNEKKNEDEEEEKEEIKKEENKIEDFTEKDLKNKNLKIDYITEIIKKYDDLQNKLDFTNYFLLEFKTNQYKNQVLKHKEDIKKLLELNFIKFSDIFQWCFYLYKFKKEDINLEKTNIFNYRNFKNEKKDIFFENIEKYNYSGYKEGEYKRYNLLDIIEKKFKLFEDIKVQEYFYPLFILLRYIKNLINLRLENIKKRKKEFNRYLEIREKKLNQKIEREEKKKSELQTAKNDFYSSFDDPEKNSQKNEEEKSNEENEDEKSNEENKEESTEEKERLEFNEEEWLDNWTKINPVVFIPKELELDEDKDVSSDFYVTIDDEEKE